ncbi:MAG: phosphotyrosine protein phosphatase [Anaerolinea sp.]|nr:phosphotyrosine protein phosphatase [Anaerolinea sp.]
MDAVNTYQVFDWLWTSGQISEDDIKQIQLDGFDTIINLALPTSTNAIKREAELIANLHMNYINIPVEWELPEVEQFELCAGMLIDLHERGHKVWMHCALNNRVSVFVYLYRKLILEQPEEEALHPMKEIWEPNPLWREYMDEVVDR